jgi:hypothetical protein
MDARPPGRTDPLTPSGIDSWQIREEDARQNVDCFLLLDAPALLPYPDGSSEFRFRTHFNDE